MKPLPDKIKFVFTQSELLNLSTIIHQNLTDEMPEQVDKSAKAMFYLTQTNLKRLYNRIRIKIEDGPLTGNVKFSLKPPEYLAFYVLYKFNEDTPNQSLKMLINKILLATDQKL